MVWHTLELNNITLEANDVIAPHLYDWKFDGVDDYIRVSYFNESRRELTVDLLVKLSRSGASYDTIIGRSWEQDYGWRVYEDLGNTKIVFTYQDINGDSHWILKSGVLSTGVWYRISVVFDVENTEAFMYVDGEVVSSSNTVYEIGNRIANVEIGAGEGSYWKGYMSCVLVYNRVLAGDEISQSYNNSIINASDMVLFLDATFWNGSIYKDLSSYENDGMPYNDVQRIIASNKWLWLVKNARSDNNLHLMYFPKYSRIRFYNNSNLLKEVIIDGDCSWGHVVDDYILSDIPNANKVVAYIPVPNVSLFMTGV
ncbi:MAG: hypothetical protein DRG33_00900 [Deltaproteobacteria bacterium]|nr:MAG: hypothetical protein DRG33_00900 [Deltaproteobacteria bacterium]